MCVVSVTVFFGRGTDWGRPYRIIQASQLTVGLLALVMFRPFLLFVLLDWVINVERLAFKYLELEKKIPFSAVCEDV